MVSQPLQHLKPTCIGTQRSSFGPGTTVLSQPRNGHLMPACLDVINISRCLHIHSITSSLPADSEVSTLNLSSTQSFILAHVNTSRWSAWEALEVVVESHGHPCCLSHFNLELITIRSTSIIPRTTFLSPTSTIQKDP